MEWASEMQREWLGQDAEAVLMAAEMAELMGDLRQGVVVRVRLSTGDAVWVRLTKSGALQCLAIAPWDDVWSVDVVDEAAFFSIVWPVTWRTKGRDRSRKGDRDPYRIGGFCAVRVGDAREVMLCEVAALQGGDVLSVRTVLDGPEMPPGALAGASTWWPVDAKHDEGARKLMEQAGRPLLIHNWRLACMRMSNAVMPAMRKAKMRRDAARKDKPEGGATPGSLA